MTLQVPYDTFAERAKHVAGASEVFVIAHGTGSLVSCANPAKGIHIVASSSQPVDKVKAELSQALTVLDGIWTEDPTFEIETDPISRAHVVAVAYHSTNHVPGVWVDAFPDHPTHVQVLKSMYDEFRQTGEVEDISFEEFVRLSNPNVVVVPPAQLRGFLDAHLAKAHA